jgi:hypothetical protein
MRSDAQIEVTSTFCYGNASPGDNHLLADIVAVDADIVRWLERRERRRSGGQRQRAFTIATNLNIDGRMLASMVSEHVVDMMSEPGSAAAMSHGAGGQYSAS